MKLKPITITMIKEGSKTESIFATPISAEIFLKEYGIVTDYRTWFNGIELYTEDNNICFIVKYF